MLRIVLSTMLLIAGCAFDPSGAGRFEIGDGKDDVDSGAGDDPPGADAGPGPSVPLFADGFEHGLGLPWSGTIQRAGDNLMLTDKRAQSGDFSVVCITDQTGGAQATLYVDIEPSQNLYVRAHFYLEHLGEGDFETSQFISLLSMVNLEGEWDNLLSVGIRGNGAFFGRNDITDEDIPTDGRLSPNAWHRIDMRLVTAGHRFFVVDLDGETVIEESADDLPPITRVLAGIVWQGDATEAHTLFVDEVTIDDKPIP